MTEWEQLVAGGAAVWWMGQRLRLGGLGFLISKNKLWADVNGLGLV